MRSLRATLPVLVFAIVALAGAGAQQITRVAVLDLPKVLAAFPKETVALRDFDTKKAEVQAEADRRVAEIKALQSRKAAADSAGDISLSASLDAETTKKTTDLKEYVRARQAELDIMAKALGMGATFLQRLDQQIKQVAETEGYSLVINLKPDSSASQVLWFSSTVDITDRVIQAMTTASR